MLTKISLKFTSFAAFALLLFACDEPRATVDGGASDAIAVDLGVIDAAVDGELNGCLPQSDADFCIQVEGCGPTSGVDNCGLPRDASCQACAEVQCDGGTISTPESVERLRGCTHITRWLSFEGSALSDFSAAKDIRKIDGKLSLELLSVSSVTFPVLRNVEELYVSSNPGLGSLLLPELNEVRPRSGLGQIRVNNNDALRNVDMPKLSGVMFLTFNGNPNLLSAGNFDSMTQVGDLDFSRNHQLTIPSFPVLTRARNIVIWSSLFTSDVAGFNAVTQVEEELEIRQNGSLTNISGFNALPDAGTLRIYDNVVLSNISGFQSFSGSEVICHGEQLPEAMCSRLEMP